MTGVACVAPPVHQAVGIIEPIDHIPAIVSNSSKSYVIRLPNRWSCWNCRSSSPPGSTQQQHADLRARGPGRDRRGRRGGREGAADGQRARPGAQRWRRCRERPRRLGRDGRGRIPHGVQARSALESHGVVADWKPDTLTVYASTQVPMSVRDELAAIFKLPKSKVRVLTEYMGGGFRREVRCRQRRRGGGAPCQAGRGHR